jgi:hypothetical protein
MGNGHHRDQSPKARRESPSRPLGKAAMREGACCVRIGLKQQNSDARSKIASRQEGCQIGDSLSRTLDRTLGFTKSARLSLHRQNAPLADFAASDRFSGLPDGLVPTHSASRYSWNRTRFHPRTLGRFVESIGRRRSTVDHGRKLVLPSRSYRTGVRVPFH